MNSKNKKAHRPNGGQRDAVPGLTRQHGIRRRRYAAAQSKAERDGATAKACTSSNLHDQAERLYPQLYPLQCAVFAALINDQMRASGGPFRAQLHRIAKRTNLRNDAAGRVFKQLIELGLVVVVQQGTPCRAHDVRVVDPLPSSVQLQQDPNARTYSAKSREELPDVEVEQFVDKYVDGKTCKSGTIDRALTDGIPRKQAQDLMYAALARRLVSAKLHDLPERPATGNETRPIRRARAHILIREVES